MKSIVNDNCNGGIWEIGIAKRITFNKTDIQYLYNSMLFFNIILMVQEKKTTNKETNFHQLALKHQVNSCMKNNYNEGIWQIKNSTKRTMYRIIDTNLYPPYINGLPVLRIKPCTVSHGCIQCGRHIGRLRHFNIKRSFD